MVAGGGRGRRLVFGVVGDPGQRGEAGVGGGGVIGLPGFSGGVANGVWFFRGIRPPTIWCPACNQRTQQAVPSVSVRALILALGRFGIVAAAEVKSLEKRWAKHRKENNLDRNGKPNPPPSTGSERQGPDRHSHDPT